MGIAGPIRSLPVFVLPLARRSLNPFEKTSLHEADSSKLIPSSSPAYLWPSPVDYYDLLSANEISLRFGESKRLCREAMPIIAPRAPTPESKCVR